MKPDQDGLGLVQRVGRGDVDAVVEFYKKHVDFVYRSVYNQVDRNQHIAEDIVQEIFIAVIEAARNYKGNGEERTWLYTITNRKVADHYRKKKVKDKHIVCSYASNDTMLENLEAPVDIETSSISKFYVQDILEKMPLHYKQVLFMKYMENMSLSEIAIVMGKSIKSVEGLLTRAKEQFRKYLDQK